MGGCLLILLRPVLTLALGVLFFVAFLWWGLQDNVTGKLLTAEFYTDTISQEDAYNPHIRPGLTGRGVGGYDPGLAGAASRW